METKLVKDLQVGDRVVIKDPDGVGEIVSKERSKLFQASGGCWAMDIRVIEGPNKGKKITDQHHAGDMEVEIPGKSEQAA